MVSSVVRTPIRTGTDGIRTAVVELEGASAGMPLYVARPANDQPAPIVLVLHQIYGPNDYTRDVCRRLAHAGHLAILPNLYFRHGSVEGLSREEITSGVAAKIDDATVLSDLDNIVAWSGKAWGGDASRLSAIGFAWGGQFVWLYAAHSDRMRAGASWYGRLVRDAAPTRLMPWRQVVKELKAPVLGIYAGTDPYVSDSTLGDMRTALRDAPVATEICFYPEAQHGFHADYQPHYREDDAKDAWARQMSWLSQHGASK